MTDEVKMSLVAKVAQACDAVGGIEKKGKNQEQGYNYVKAADVAKAIRHELFSRGVLIIPSEGECLQERITTNAGKTMTEIKLKVTFTLTDGTESLGFDSWGIARDSGDKAIYKAKTGALKYFLRGLGLIPDEKDDPEFEEAAPLVDRKAERGFKKDYERKTVDQARTITPAEAKVFWAAVKKGGKTNDQVKNMFRLMKIESTEAMLYSDFDYCLRWAAGMESDLSETLKKSVEVTHNFPRLFALAREKGVPEADVKQLGHEIYKVESLKELSKDQFSELLDHIERMDASA